MLQTNAMMQFLNNESFWLAVCFAILVIFAYNPVKNSIQNILDSKITEIKTYISEAQNLKTDAEALLKKTKQQLTDIERTNQQALAEAITKADLLFEERCAEINILLEKRKSETVNIIKAKQAAVYAKLQNELIIEVKQLVKEYFISSKEKFSDLEIAKSLIAKSKPDLD